MFQYQTARLIPCLFALILGLQGEVAPTKVAPGRREELKISYALAISDPASGEVEVSVLIENPPEAKIELVLPCWAPGRYIRDDFAALVTGESARLEGGVEVPIERIGSHVYRIDCDGKSLLFSYRIHAGHASLGTSLVDPRGALLNPGSLVPYVRGARDSAVSIYLSGPETWRWASSLQTLDAPGRFGAASWDILARTPILGGLFTERIIEDEGLRLNLVVLASSSAVGNGAGAALEALLPAACKMLGKARVAEATIIVHALEASCETGFRAGRNFGLLVLDLKAAENELPQYLAAATVELFLGDALQPPRAGMNDMLDLPMRDDLWVAPAFSRYLGAHLLHRAGLSGDQELLSHLAGMADEADRATSGRKISLIEAGRRMALRRAEDPRRVPDGQAGAWFEPIKRGELAAFYLDLHLRAASDGKIGLVDALRLLQERAEDFSLARLRRAISDRGGRPAGTLLDQLVDEITYPDRRELAGHAGFVFEFESSSVGLGLELDGDQVVSVQPGSAAAKAGIQVRDRIVRLDGHAVKTDAGERIAAMRSGQRTTITVARRGGMVTLPISVQGFRRAGWRLVPTEDEAAEGIRAGFLGREKAE